MAKITVENLVKVENLKGMMRSCFTYGGLDKNNYNHSRYIQPLIDDLGEDCGNRIYEDYKQYLDANFRVENCVHTDKDGCTYNSLIEISTNEPFTI